MFEELYEKLEEDKMLVWNDDDYYEMGYNQAIDIAKLYIKEYFEPVPPFERYLNDYRCRYCGKEVTKQCVFCSKCGKPIKWS